MTEFKTLPIHSAAKALEKNIIDIPLGQPLFRDKRYNSIDLNTDFFSPLPELDDDRKIAFVDGGNVELIKAPNFAIGLTRLYFNLFKGSKRLEAVKVPQRIEFYTVSYTSVEKGEIFYKTELVPIKEEWSKYLPKDSDLEFDSFDPTIMSGNQRAPISRVLGVSRVFAEWCFSGFIAGEELQNGEVLIRDGTLQTTVTKESKYANEAYNAALEKGVYFAALAKTSTLFTDTGLPLFSAIHTLSESSKLKDSEWYYHPIVEITHPDHKAEMFAVKLFRMSEYVFRFEVLRDQVKKSNFNDIELIISALSKNSQDIGFPGYPYGLFDADKFARVTMMEQNANSFQLLAAIGQKEVWKKISRFVKSSDAHDTLNGLIG